MAERERVIIADFENRTGDSTLVVVVTEVSRPISFTESPPTRPLPPEQVVNVLKTTRARLGRYDRL